MADIIHIRGPVCRPCRRVKNNLNNCTFQEKRQDLNALDVQVVATREKMKIRIVVPLELFTIDQTSGCLSGHAYDHYIPFFIST